MKSLEWFYRDTRGMNIFWSLQGVYTTALCGYVSYEINSVFLILTGLCGFVTGWFVSRIR